MCIGGIIKNCAGIQFVEFVDKILKAVNQHRIPLTIQLPVPLQTNSHINIFAVAAGGFPLPNLGCRCALPQVIHPR